MAEVDREAAVERAIVDASRKFGWDSELEEAFRLVVGHLDRSRILSMLVSQWYPRQLEAGGAPAWSAWYNTAMRLAEAFDIVARELRRMGVDIMAVDLPAHFEVAVDYDPTAMRRLAEDILERIRGRRRTKEAAELVERYASEVEREVEGLAKMLKALEEVSPEAYQRALTRVLEAIGLVDIIQQLVDDIERLERELSRARRAEREKIRELERRVRELEEALRRARERVAEATAEVEREVERAVERKEERVAPAKEKYPACPTGEESIPLNILWALFHPDADEAAPLLGEFKRWAERTWSRLSSEVKYFAFRQLETLPARISRVWTELYRTFAEELRRRLPLTAAMLEALPSPVSDLGLFALCPNNWRIYRIEIRRGREVLGRPVTEASLRRYLAPILEATGAAKHPALTMILRGRMRRPGTGLGVIQFMATPDMALRVIGGACPICGSTELICNVTDFGQTSYCTCKNCGVAYLYNPISGRKEVRIPTYWEKVPGFKKEWLEKLEELKNMGWEVR